MAEVDPGLNCSRSSVGRAPGLHPVGPWFESRREHNTFISKVTGEFIPMNVFNQ